MLFLDVVKRRILPKEASINKTKMAEMKIAIKKCKIEMINKR